MPRISRCGSEAGFLKKLRVAILNQPKATATSQSPNDDVAVETAGREANIKPDTPQPLHPSETRPGPAQTPTFRLVQPRGVSRCRRSGASATGTRDGPLATSTQPPGAEKKTRHSKCASRPLVSSKFVVSLLLCTHYVAPDHRLHLLVLALSLNFHHHAYG
jgi:hypothetical protein